MKQIAVNLIEEAVDAGARRHQAGDILGISCRTLLRWQAAGDDLADKRRQTNNRHYTHALTQEEKHHILASSGTTRNIAIVVFSLSRQSSVIAGRIMLF